MLLAWPFNTLHFLLPSPFGHEWPPVVPIALCPPSSYCSPRAAITAQSFSQLLLHDRPTMCVLLVSLLGKRRHLSELPFSPPPPSSLSHPSSEPHCFSYSQNVPIPLEIHTEHCSWDLSSHHFTLWSCSTLWLCLSFFLLLKFWLKGKLYAPNMC